MRRMKQAFLKLKSCASSVIPRCLLTVVLNRFKKPVYLGFFRTVFCFLPEQPHPNQKVINLIPISMTSYYHLKNDDTSSITNLKPYYNITCGIEHTCN